MKSERAFLIVAAAAAIVAAFPIAGTANDGGRRAPTPTPPPRDVVVEFGQPQPQTLPVSATHVLLPDDATVREGGTVTFVVNGGGHGVAIYPVSRNTTRKDISDDLCQGGDTVCNGAAGTQNLQYLIRDGRRRLIIDTDTAANNARVDDPRRRLLSTSGAIPVVEPTPTPMPGATPVPGAFLVGTTPTAAGNRIQYRFTQPGRYLVICQNRGHLLNDWMFGFVNVVGNDRDDHDNHHDNHHDGR